MKVISKYTISSINSYAYTHNIARTFSNKYFVIVPVPGLILQLLFSTSFFLAVSLTIAILILSHSDKCTFHTISMNIEYKREIWMKIVFLLCVNEKTTHSVFTTLAVTYIFPHYYEDRLYYMCMWERCD